MTARCICLGLLLTALLIRHSAAQQSAIVQCRIGSYERVMPDFVCDALTAGASKLTGQDNPDRDRFCTDEVWKHLRFSPEAAGPVIQACEEIREAKVFNARTGN